MFTAQTRDAIERGAALVSIHEVPHWKSDPATGNPG
jgi:hypothetical protein